MAEVNSIENINRVFEDLATRHYFINSYGWGVQWEIAAERITYPCLWVTPVTASMPRSEDNDRYTTIEVELEVSVLDAVHKDESNEIDAHSDTLTTLTEIVNQINDHPYYTNSTLLLTEDIDFEALEEFSDDQTAGWRALVTLKLSNNKSFCGAPLSDLEGFSFAGIESSGVTYQTRYLTCSTVTGCTQLQDYVAQQVATVTDNDNFTTGATYSGQSLTFDRTNGLGAYSVDLSNLSASTLYVASELWTVELIDAQSVDFYAPYQMTIESWETVLSASTISLLDDGAAYTTGNTIDKGSKITVSASTPTVINLNTTH